MTPDDFAAHVAADVGARVARILPLLDEWCAGEDADDLTESQRIALGSLLFSLFDGLTDAVTSMVVTHEIIQGFVGPHVPLGDEIAAYLRDVDDGLMQ